MVTKRRLLPRSEHARRGETPPRLVEEPTTLYLATALSSVGQDVVVVLQDDTMYALRAYFDGESFFDEIQINVTQAGSTGLAKMAIYNEDINTLLPGSLFDDAGQVVLFAGIDVRTLGKSPAPAGYYWLVMATFDILDAVPETRPTSPDISRGSWLGNPISTPIYLSVDEGIVDDVDFIESSSNPSNDACELTVQNWITVPNVDLEVSFRALDTGGKTLNLTCELKEGATVRGSRTITTTPGFITYVFTVDVTLFTDLQNLSLRFNANVTGGGSPTTCQISHTFLSAPGQAPNCLSGHAWEHPSLVFPTGGAVYDGVQVGWTPPTLPDPFPSGESFSAVMPIIALRRAP